MPSVSDLSGNKRKNLESQ